MTGKFETVDEYIENYPAEVKATLLELRQTIKKAAPDAEEKISYNMPAYKQQGMLVYFAAYEKHIGFYPTPSGITAFVNELAAYKGAKGSVQFPIDQPLPLNLIGNIVRFRVEENLMKAREKKKK